MNQALVGSILKLNIQRAFFLTFLSKIVADSIKLALAIERLGIWKLLQ